MVDTDALVVVAAVEDSSEVHPPVGGGHGGGDGADVGQVLQGRHVVVVRQRLEAHGGGGDLEQELTCHKDDT